MKKIVQEGCVGMKQMKRMCFLFVSLIVVFLASGAYAARNNSVFIVSSDRTLVMVPVPAASGEKYEALGDPSSTFWIKGDEATLNIEGKVQPQYVLVIRPSRDCDCELFLSVDGRNYRMQRTLAASGVKYEAVNNGETTLWEKGGAVTLTIAGVDYPGYDLWQPFGRIWLPE